MPDSSFLRVQNLETFYGPVQALKGIGFEVARGERVAIIGANGAGKSTILKTLSGALKAKKGRVTFQEENLSSLAPDEVAKRGIGHVPEGREVFPLLTVAENLRLGAFNRKNWQSSLEEVLLTFPILKGKYKQPAGLLSGGEQQMLALGRAMMQDPKILLLDEPSLGLAPKLIKELFTVLLRLNEEHGLTMIMVEQNARAALDWAHRGYVLELGRIMLEGPTEELKENEDIKEFYLGGRDEGIRGRKRWKRRKSWG
jgi:branched-chain amino acid transport system ATP-binding protein